jgi:glycosidase
MQWTSDGSRGFTSQDTTPWLPFSDTATTVASQVDEPDSMLTLYRNLLDLRRREPTLAIGGMTMLSSSEEHVLAYERQLDGDSMIIAINFTQKEQPIEFSREVRQILSTHAERSESFAQVTLRPNEAVVVR